MPKERKPSFPVDHCSTCKTYALPQKGASNAGSSRSFIVLLYCRIEAVVDKIKESEFGIWYFLSTLSPLCVMH